MRNAGRALVVAATAAAVAACGTVSPQHRSITLRGAINATYAPGPPGSCGAGDTLVTGMVGADRLKDYADLTVSDSGHLTLDAPQLGGSYTGSGVTFRPGQGWDIDATLRSSSGQSIVVTGRLPC